MSGWYLDGLEQLLARTIPESALVYAVGVNDEYVFNENHVNPAVLADFILLPEAELQNVTFTTGILDADDYKWLAAGTGITDRSLQLKGVVIYFQEGGFGTLLAYIDSATVGLPSTLTGVNVTAQWASNGILRL